MTPDEHEFINALYMACRAGQLDLLRNYVDTGRPIPQYNDVYVRGHIRMPMHVLVAQLLGRCPPQQPENGAGRRRRVTSEAPAAEQAERNAAWLAAFRLKSWRERHGRERVPPDVTGKIVTAARAEAAETFKAPLDTICERNIRNVLKNGSIVVR